MELVMFIAGLAFLIPASYIDWKTREVPDLISYGLIVVGISLGVLSALLTRSFLPLWSMLLGLGVGVLLGVLLYYTGQWGGADSKLLMGLGALLGVGFGTFDTLLFVVLLMLSGALYGFCYMLVLAVHHRKKTLEKLKSILRRKNVARARLGVILFCFFLLIIIFFSATSYKFWLFFAVLLVYVFFYLWLIAKGVEEAVLTKKYAVGKLTEGDWVQEEVKVKGKVLCSPKDHGISQEQIAALKRAQIKAVLVKEGIPFIPSFLVAFLLLWWLGPRLAELVALFF